MELLRVLYDALKGVVQRPGMVWGCSEGAVEEEVVLKLDVVEVVVDQVELVELPCGVGFGV